VDDGGRDLVAVIRGVVSTLVGAILVLYGVAGHADDAALIVILGLVLLGVVAIDALPIGRRRP